jgi:hypothetical protein
MFKDVLGTPAEPNITRNRFPENQIKSKLVISIADLETLHSGE